MAFAKPIASILCQSYNVLIINILYILWHWFISIKWKTFLKTEFGYSMPGWRYWYIKVWG
jgi:hypothetical protein